MFRIRAGLAFCAAAPLLLTACGEEVPRTPPAQSKQTFSGHVCDLVEASELSQIFVSRLEADHGEPPTPATCTWNEVDSGSPAFSYEVHPYIEDLEHGVPSLAAGRDGELALEIRPGLGDAAVWSSLGLFVSRNGRTLQVTPFDEEVPRALFEELSSLLLDRLEKGGRSVLPAQ